MSLLLNIDTAFDTASICIADNNTILQKATNEQFKDHAAWLHTTIQQLLKEQNISINDIAAISVNNGPGSYTGLRVGLSAAKGFCFALDIPLITIHTLVLMASAGISEAEEIICPLIDARRMEVFTACYDKTLKQVLEPQALILDENSFSEILTNQKILFCGNAVEKIKTVVKNAHASFSNKNYTMGNMAQISFEKFINNDFSDLAYSAPFYVKDFYTNAIKKK